MSHLLAVLFCLAGFAALACATRRQQRDLFGNALGPFKTVIIRLAGACALLFALCTLAAWHGWSMGVVMFSGHTSLAAAVIYCFLVGYARALPARRGRSRP